MPDLSGAMGALLWRRVYTARREIPPVVHVLPETLEALLRQAGVPEPDDDVVFVNGEVRHGRTGEKVKRA